MPPRISLITPLHRRENHNHSVARHFLIVMAYFVYYNDSIVGMTLEVIAYNGEDFGVCVAYTTDRTEIENVLPQLR